MKTKPILVAAGVVALGVHLMPSTETQPSQQVTESVNITEACLGDTCFTFEDGKALPVSVETPFDIEAEIAAIEAESELKRQTYQDIECLAEAVYFEARGENLDGRKSVANVVMNRVESKHFPDNVCDVVNQPYQFSYKLGSYVVNDVRAWDAAVKVATMVYNRDYDRTEGALYYYNPEKVRKTPSWVADEHFIKAVGKHHFYAWHKVK